MPRSPPNMQGEQYSRELWAIGAHVTPAASLAALELLGNVKKWTDCACYLPGMPYATQEWERFFKHAGTHKVRHVQHVFAGTGSIPKSPV